MQASYYPTAGEVSAVNTMSLLQNNNNNNNNNQSGNQ